MPPIVIAAAIVAAAAVGGAALSASAAKKAAKAQKEAAATAAQATTTAQDRAIAEQQRQFDLARGDLAPYREVGAESLRTLRDLNQPGGELQEEFAYPRSAFEADPGYEFRLSEGMKLLERSAAARGGLLSGRTLKDLTRFGQGTASDEYQRAYTRKFNEFQVNRGNRFNRLAALAGIGQAATTTTANLGTATGANIGQTYLTTGGRLADIATQAGNARASGYIGSTAPYAQAVGSLGQAAGQYYTLNQLGFFGSGNTGGTAGTVAPPPVPSLYEGGGTNAY